LYDVRDNIVALATTPGRSAINVVRVSGPNTKSIVESFFINTSKKLKKNGCFVVNLFNPKTKEFVDQSVVSFFKKPHSFTGQDVVEISTHGGFLIAEKLIKMLCDLGCRNASAGEFSYRAFINGKIDLIQAEAIANIIHTNSDIDVLFSLENLSGALSKKIISLCGRLKKIITYMEHELDFNENEIDFVGFKDYSEKIKKLMEDVDHILNSSFITNQKECDVVISISGEPNVGKSSLFNALLGNGRSIVTDVSGTTRDFVDAQINVEGVQVSLVDTAGIRKTKNKVEKEGIKKAEEKIKESDLIILVDDKDPVQIKKNLNFKNKNLVLVQNKIDINKPCKNKGVYHISCKDNVGISELFTCLSTYIKKHKLLFVNNNTYIISDRLSSLLGLFIKKLSKTVDLLNKTEDITLITSSLYDAYDVFVSSASPSNKEEIINNIFKGFCVGK